MPRLLSLKPRSKARAFPFSGGLSVSSGDDLRVAVADDGPSDLSALLDAADQALYRAKALGRNRVEPSPHWAETIRWWSRLIDRPGKRCWGLRVVEVFFHKNFAALAVAIEKAIEAAMLDQKRASSSANTAN
jgi:hypothetical protein